MEKSFTDTLASGRKRVPYKRKKKKKKYIERTGFVVTVEKRNMLANELVKRQGNNNDNISNQQKTQIRIRGRHSCVTLSPSFDRSIPLQLCLSSRVLGYQTLGMMG